MPTLTRQMKTFPAVSLPSYCDGLPVEVTLIAQLGHGSGDQLAASVGVRQQSHPGYVDALDEPSTRLGSVDLARGDATALYSFVVGDRGHPFHRHAGHRMFTAVTGSSGARLRFSTASDAQLAEDPRHFVRAMHVVDVPPDCLLTARFGGGTWHQFLPLVPGNGHPALFALSCHTDELGGGLTPVVEQLVRDGEGTIASLTELLPSPVQAVLDAPGCDPGDVPAIALSLSAPSRSLASRMCAAVRAMSGTLRTMLAGSWPTSGFVSDTGGGRRVMALDVPPTGSMLHRVLGGDHDHLDCFVVPVERGELRTGSARVALAALLDGFLDNPPVAVSRLMRLRNVLVAPLGLRTSALGCPVSSLLAPTATQLFCDRFPVLDQYASEDGCIAEVMLGADDKHLVFRSCVRVEIADDGAARCFLATRVRTRNLFGRVYMALIDRVHRGYIAPTMLRLATDHALKSLRGNIGGIASAVGQSPGTTPLAPTPH